MGRERVTSKALKDILLRALDAEPACDDITYFEICSAVGPPNWVARFYGTASDELAAALDKILDRLEAQYDVGDHLN